MKPARVLAVDPGYDRLGVAVLELQNGKEVLLHSQCIQTDPATALDDRLVTLGEAFRDLLKTHTPTIVGIETLFFNKNVTTAIGVAQARGIIMYLAR
ncbi:crossover junction endodeoxyribonuclease RuvC, partial [Candidatus Pacebacteria bacterium]|nr:crossover junction endodeoxyribonuclease RuvC [Candidatus Paceibacterota bacterium]